MMNKLSLQEALQQELNNKLLWGILLIYTFIGGTYLALAKDMHASLNEYILLLLSNHYYLIYGLLFFFLFWSAHNMKRKNDLEIIRYQSYSNYFFNHLKSVFIKILLWLVMHIIIAFMLGISNMGFKTGFRAHEIPEYYSENVQMLFMFREYFKAPVLAIIAVISFLSFGFMFIYTIVFTCFQLYGNRISIIVILIVLANIFIGFKTTFDEGPLCFLFFNNYFILHHALFLNGISAVFIVLGIQIMSMWILWRKLICKKRNR